MLLLYAILPLAVLLILMLVFRRSAAFSLPIAWLCTLIIVMTIWQMSLVLIYSAMMKGLLVAFEIMLIVFGALVLLASLKDTGCLKGIKKTLSCATNDIRIHAIIIAWSFGAFIEGAAGFGSPAVLAAPLLYGLGMSPVNAVIISLIADSTPVSFGAVGVPITIGIRSVVSDPMVISQVSFYSALIHSMIGIFIPLLIACITSKFTCGSFLKGLEVWKFAIFAGFSFIIPYFLFSFIGPEFPSFAGGLVGLIIVLSAARFGLFLKKTKIRTKHFIPYLIAAVLLGISRLSNFSFEIKLAGGLIQSFYPLKSPGIIFLFSAFLTYMYFKRKGFSDAIKCTAPKAFRTFIVLAFATSLVQMYVFSGENMISMPSVVAQSLSGLGILYIIFSPLLGMFGAFITGSNTVSNLLFAPFQLETALSLSILPSLILALQNIGGAVGNMIAPHNVVAASATVNIKGHEGDVIRSTIIPALIYAIAAGVIGLLIYYL